MFDDALKPTLRIREKATVAAGIFRTEPQHGKRIAALHGLGQPPHGCRGDQRDVAIQDENDAGKTAQRRLGHAHRMSGSQLRFLYNGLKAGKGRMDLFAPCPYDQNRPRRAQSFKAFKQMCQHGASGQRM